MIRYWDSRDTVFYLDPPYVASTRVDKAVYSHECDDSHHRALVDLLLDIQGQAMLSRYDNPLYAPLEQAGWERHGFQTACYAAARTRRSGLQDKGAALAKLPRTEVVWIKRHAQAISLPVHGQQQLALVVTPT